MRRRHSIWFFSSYGLTNVQMILPQFMTPQYGYLIELRLLHWKRDFSKVVYLFRTMNFHGVLVIKESKSIIGYNRVEVKGVMK